MPTITDLGYNQYTKTKREQTLKSMKARISYIYNKSTKIDSILLELDSIEHICKQFIDTKNKFNKLDGNIFFHYVISFSEKDTIDENQAMDIIENFLEYKKFNGFQIMYGIHQDTDNIHAHLLINSVNSITGKKWHMSNNEWIPLQIRLNEIAKPYGCIIPKEIAKKMNITQEKNINSKKTKEEKNKYEEDIKIKNKSWKQNTKQTIEYIIKNSVDIDDFINNSKKVGYDIYKNKSEEYVISIKSINKKISLKKLEINYSDMIDRFVFNNENLDIKKM